MSARRIVRVVVAVAVVVVTAGCGLTVQQLPLPKPGVQDGITIHAVFENALNLPTQAKVKLSGSDVGQVTAIHTRNYQAIVDLRIRRDISLPDGTTAELRQGTPLGDVFVAVTKPRVPSGTRLLRDGDTLPIERTSAGATVEELLLSVSLLFNGGGLVQLTKIANELDSIVGGRSDQVVHLVNELTGVVTSLNNNSARIDRVLNEFHTLTDTIDARRAELGRVADTLPGLLGTIAENNKTLTDLLHKVSVSSAAIGDYSSSSGAQLASLLDNTHQLMSALAATGNNFGAALDAVHDLKGPAHATFKGGEFAVPVSITSLDVALLTAPGTSKFFDMRDLADFAGSLIQVLQMVQHRLAGRPR